MTRSGVVPTHSGSSSRILSDLASPQIVTNLDHVQRLDLETRVRDRFVVSAPVAGQVLRIDLEPGDPVREGETVLATRQGGVENQSCSGGHQRSQAVSVAAWRAAMVLL